ncbi:MAG: hypothetical protein IIC32_06620 [Chloroflexi bacterium]|nr:hypothetical protein [Chloroflexota bacterium]
MAAKRSARTTAMAVALLVGTAIGGLVYAMPLTSTVTFSGSETVLDFEGLGLGPVAPGEFAGLGVTFSGDFRVTTFTSTWPGQVAQGFTDVTAHFTPPVLRAGMDIITNPGDDVRLSAFLGGDPVDAADFATDLTPTFIGLEVTGGFDTLVIHVFDSNDEPGGSFLVDDFRFETGGDAIPPVVTASLAPVGEEDEDERLFRVTFTCIDDTDPSPTATAGINGVAVADGQLVELKLTGGTKQRSKWHHGVLSFKASSFLLTVTCADAAGNTASASAEPVFSHSHDDDEDEDDDDDDDDDEDDDDDDDDDD